MEEKINTHLANDLEQSAAMLDSREFDAVQLDNCASMMRYAATVIRQALANAALDRMADNARELGLSYEQPAPAQDPVARRAAWNKTIRDSVDSLLAQAGYQPDSSARYQLDMMNFDTPPAPAPAQLPPNCGTGYCSCIECLKGGA